MAGKKHRSGPVGGSPQSMSAEHIRASLWFWPVIAAGVSLVVALLLLPVTPEQESDWARVAWPADAASAVALLQTVATATMAAATLTFSLTVIALQLSSQQFSPRLLRQFARDRFTQALIALLVSTFVVALTGLRGIREDSPLPVLLLALVSVLGVCSIIGLLTFIGHMVRSLRVETMMVSVHEETIATIEQTYPVLEDTEGLPDGTIGRESEGTLVPARRSGFLRVVRTAHLVRACRELGVVCELLVRPGDHLVEGTPVALAWNDDGSPAELSGDLQHALDAALDQGYERTV